MVTTDPADGSMPEVCEGASWLLCIFDMQQPPEIERPSLDFADPSTRTVPTLGLYDSTPPTAAASPPYTPKTGPIRLMSWRGGTTHVRESENNPMHSSQPGFGSHPHPLPRRLHSTPLLLALPLLPLLAPVLSNPRDKQTPERVNRRCDLKYRAAIRSGRRRLRRAATQYMCQKQLLTTRATGCWGR